MNGSNEKYKGSLTFRTWLYFVGMTVAVLVVLWVCEIIYFNAYYRNMKVREYSRVAESIAESYRGVPDPTFDALVENSVTSNQYALAIFTLGGKQPDEATEHDVSLITYRDPANWNTETGNPDSYAVEFTPDEDFYSSVLSDGKTYTYSLPSNTYRKYNALICCTSREYHIGTVYFYSVFIIPPLSMTTSLLASQFIVVSCVCLVISALLSFALSKNFTRPLTQFAATAKLMGKGQKVVFRRCGYSEFDELSDTLTSASEEIERTDKLRKDFLANVSHDLRTPLTMVKAYAEMIRDISYKNDAKRNEHIKVIIDEVDRLTLLVNDILDLSKIQSGTKKPELTTVELSEVCSRVMERLSILEEQGYIFEVELDEGCLVTGDEHMLEQVFYNLIGNAVSYTGADKRVSVKIKRDGDTVKFSVTDTGKGIAPSEKEKIWDRYYRANQSKRAVVGSGIGLSIVKNLLIAHSAEYGIDSVINRGSTFWFRLPLLKPQNDE